MEISKNEKIRNFLYDLKIIDTERYETVIEIRKIIFNTFPNVSEKMMYGGIIFFLNTEMFSGLFVNKNHITVEFSKGYLMVDPFKRLEGKGKYRRHLKIKSNEDLKNKEVAYFVKQAVD